MSRRVAERSGTGLSWIAAGSAPALCAAAWIVASQAGSPGRALCGLALLGAPFLERLVARGRSAQRRSELLLLGLLAQLAGLALLGAPAGALWIAATCQALSRARGSAALAAAGLLALGTAVATLRAAPSAWTLAAPFATSLGVLPGLLRAASQAARSRALRGAAPIAAEPGRRAGVGAALLVAPALFVLLALSARLTSASTADSARERATARAQAQALAEPDDEVAGATRWSERISFGEGVGRLSDEIVLWAAPDQRPQGALHLAVLALDRFDERGLGQPRLAALREVADPDDGRRDGWIDLARGPAADELELHVVQRPLRVGRLGGDALVRLEPLHSLSVARALYEPDVALVLPGAREGWLEYRLRAARPRSLGEPPARARAAHPEARYSELPEPSRELERVRAHAARVFAGADGDRACVDALLAHFARDFEYSLEGAGFSGVAGALAFLDERAGYCTSFAASAVLLLRSRGIACRAVGGYLADEWDEARGAFVVRGRDAHAWIEVHFEGHGWRTFDPTPARARERAFQRGEGLLAPELGEWSSALVAALGESAGDGGEASLARLGAQLALAPAVLRQELVDLAPAGRAALLALPLALAALAWMLRRGARARDAGAAAAAGVARGPYARLLARLAALGHRPGASESLRRFAQRVEVALPGFAAATETHLAERFGGLEPERVAREFLEGLSARADLIARERARI